MPGYPVIFDLSLKQVTVVGAGPVGQRKTRGLLKAGALVRLVSLEPPVEVDWLEEVDLHCRPFQEQDLDGSVLAFAATGQKIIDQAVLSAARARGIPANLATEPGQGDFHVPAVLQRGDLLIAVASNGKSPAMASLLRDRLSDQFGQEWGLILQIAAQLRQRKLTEFTQSTYSYKVLENLLLAGLPEMIARREASAINRLLTQVTGVDLSLAELGLKLPSDQ